MNRISNNEPGAKFAHTIEYLFEQLLDILNTPVNYIDDIPNTTKIIKKIQQIAIHRQYKFLYDFLNLYLDIIDYMHYTIEEFSPYDIQWLRKFCEDAKRIFAKEYQATIEQSTYQLIYTEHLYKIQSYLDNQYLDSKDHQRYIRDKYTILIPNHYLDNLLLKASQYKMAMQNIFTLIDENIENDRIAIDKSKRIVSQFITNFNNLFQDRKNSSLKHLYRLLHNHICKQNKVYKKKIEFEFQGKDISVDRLLMLHITNILIELIDNVFKHGFKAIDHYAIAHITIHTHITNGQLFIHFYDDTEGIDLDNLLPTEYQQGNTLSDDMKLHKILYIVYENEVTKFLGLKRANLESRLLNGNLIYRKLDKGAEYILSLPINFQTQIFEINIDDNKYGIPVFYVHQVVPINELQIQDYQNTDSKPYFDKVIIKDKEIIPLISLEHIFGLQVQNYNNTKSDIVTILEYRDKKIGLVIKQVVGNITVYIRSITKNLFLRDKKHPYISNDTKPHLSFILGAYQINDEQILRLVLDIEDIINTTHTSMKSRLP